MHAADPQAALTYNPLAGEKSPASVLRAGCKSPPAVIDGRPVLARERPAFLVMAGVSRFGAIPKPTVIVRMQEIAVALPAGPMCPAGAWLRALILETAGWSVTMHQKSRHPENFAAQVPATEAGALRYAFIHAGWHADIVHQARDSFVAEIQRHGVAPDAIDVFEVPGAFELPLLAKKLARSGRYAALVACALVVDGGIYRHEFVADAVVSALMAVQLEVGVPVLSVVLTPHHFHAGDEHQAFFAAHFVIKGAEAARACVRTVKVLRGVDESALA